MIDLAKNLKAARKNASLTQSALAEKLNTSQRQIAKYENGVQDMTVSRLIAIAEALGTNPDELLK